jgi:hypothetical protein
LALYKQFSSLLFPQYFCPIKAISSVASSAVPLTNPTITYGFPICFTGALSPNIDKDFNKFKPDDNNAEYRLSTMN